MCKGSSKKLEEQSSLRKRLAKGGDITSNITVIRMHGTNGEHIPGTKALITMSLECRVGHWPKRKDRLTELSTRREAGRFNFLTFLFRKEGLSPC